MSFAFEVTLYKRDRQGKKTNSKVSLGHDDPATIAGFFNRITGQHKRTTPPSRGKVKILS